MSAPPRIGERIARIDAVGWALIVGTTLRVMAFPFAEDMFGDGPVRSSIARSLARAPHLAWSFADVFQFGPLLAHLEAMLLWLGLSPNTGARLVPLLFGVLGIGLAARLARRLNGATALAAWAVALDPLHLQASTTCTSETAYLAFALGAADAAIEVFDAPTLAASARLAACAFGASTTRYDSWIWLPVLGLFLVSARPTLAGLVVALSLAIGPLSILLANQIVMGHALYPLDYISQSHVDVAAWAAARMSPATWRLVEAAFWPATTLVALTPVLFVLTLRGLGRAPRHALAVCLVIALLPSALYLARGVLFGSFLPVPRMVIAPATFLACIAHPPSARWLRAGVVAAVVFDAGLLALASVTTPADPVACRITPVSRLPADLRAGVAAIRSTNGVVALDKGELWEDIVMSFHADIDRFRAYAPPEPVDRVIAIAGGHLDAELRANGTTMNRGCSEAGRVGRISWWDCHENVDREK